MNKKELLIAALGSSTKKEFSPVQLQKLMFLIDSELSPQVGGPYFNFKPYHYGPFDVAIYEEFLRLELEGLGHTKGGGRSRKYAVTESGNEYAQKILSGLSQSQKKYISEVAEFVQSLSFPQLVSSIYKAYPHMKANSVFRG